MGLESASTIDELVITNPTSGDPRSEGDDHLRMIKACLQESFPKDLRGISSPQLAQALRYDTLTGSFKNGVLKQYTCIHTDVSFPLASGIPETISFTEELKDDLSVFSLASPAQFTLPSYTAQVKFHGIVKAGIVVGLNEAHVQLVIRKISTGVEYFRGSVHVPPGENTEKLHFSSPFAPDPSALALPGTPFSAGDAMEVVLVSTVSSMTIDEVTIYMEVD